MFLISFFFQKWTQATMDGAALEELLSDDGETLVLRNAIHSNVRTSCLVLGLLLMLILIYYICKISYTDSVVCMPSVVTSAGGSRMASHVVALAGCYRLTAMDIQLSLAFNYGRRESLMTFWDDDALPLVEGHSTMLGDTQPVTLHVGRARSLSHLFLWLALAMLLAEVLLARERRMDKQKQ